MFTALCCVTPTTLQPISIFLDIIYAREYQQIEGSVTDSLDLVEKTEGTLDHCSKGSFSWISDTHE